MTDIRESAVEVFDMVQLGNDCQIADESYAVVANRLQRLGGLVVPAYVETSPAPITMAINVEHIIGELQRAGTERARLDSLFWRGLRDCSRYTDAKRIVWLRLLSEDTRILRAEDAA